MTITASGSVRCGNCGSEKFTSPQLTPNPEGGTDVFLACNNCSTPMFVFNETDPEAAKELASFFVRTDLDDE